MAYVGYEYVRSSLDLPIFEVSRPALVKPVTRIMSSAEALGVPGTLAPADGDFVAHLLFALKHEGVNLQVLASASKHLAAADLAAALAATPNGQYVRMLCSAWEHFTGNQVVAQPVITAGYVDLFDEGRYYTGGTNRDSRWRVNFNGLGSWDYCVTVERTPAIKDALDFDVLGATRDFAASLNRELLDRTLSWAYLHETQDSYAIEKEAPSEDKARTFIHLLRQAHKPRTLDEAYLVELQASIVSNPYNQAVQYRTEQNWLSDGGRGALGVTFVPPRPDDLPGLMDAWSRFANDTAKHLDPLMAASIVSVGFVYLHPFMDGNGRLSRFLFHKVLCQSGQLPDGMLLPVSVAMKRQEAQYLSVLQDFSRPARALVNARAAGEGDFEFTFKCDDTIFRFWDATRCVEFGLSMAREALEVELRSETSFLVHFDAVRKHIDDQYDLRGSTLATLVSIALDNGGAISNNKRKRYADEVTPEIFDAIEGKAREVLSDALDEPDGATSRTDRDGVPR